MPAARQRQRVDDTARIDPRLPQPAKFGIDEGHVEAGIVGNEARPVDELQEFVGDVGKGRLVDEVCRGNSVHGLGFRIDAAALRVEVPVKSAAGREAVDEFDASKLDDALVAPVKPGRLGIEDDFTHRISFSCA
jgi:hypothetical protein